MQHGARQQKRLAKQKTKRNEKQRQLARTNSSNPTIRLGAADSWPIVASLAPNNLWDLGMGQLVLARRAPGGKLACAVFLVDVYCLGVKNAFWRMMDNAAYKESIAKLDRCGRLQEVTPEFFAKLVYGAVEYAQSAGFGPHPDYRTARLLLAGIDPSRCPDEFEFGKNGKPLYIEGPDDGSLPQIRAFRNRLDAAADGPTLRLDRPSPALLALHDEPEEEAIPPDDADDDER
jgi:hypothetical protein